MARNTTPWTLPNDEPAGNDSCADAQQISAFFILYENEIGDRFWHYASMDESAAHRMSETMNFCHPGKAAIVEVPIVLPAPYLFDDVLSDIECEPLRAKITETPLVNASGESLEDVMDRAAAEVALKQEAAAKIQPRRHCAR